MIEKRTPMKALEETPKLVTWTGRLTEEGEALVSWLDTKGIFLPTVPAPRGNLLKPAALYFQAYPAEAAALWAQFAGRAG